MSNFQFSITKPNALAKSYSTESATDAAIRVINAGILDGSATGLDAILAGTDASNDTLIEVITGLSALMTTSIATEVTDRDAAIAIETTARDVAIATEVTDRDAAIAVETTARDVAIATEVTDRDAAIAVETTARETAIATEVTDRDAAIAVETTARETAIAAETTNYKLATTATLAIDNDFLVCDSTAAAFTITLPVAPVMGQTVSIIDDATSFLTNNVTVDGNGSTIDGLATLVLAVDNSLTKIVYTTQWRVV